MTNRKPVTAQRVRSITVVVLMPDLYAIVLRKGGAFVVAKRMIEKTKSHTVDESGAGGKTACIRAEAV
jgi:hypothetical protein